LRLYRPPPTAAFTGLDRLAPGYLRARELAAGHGFSPVRRRSGGRIAAYHRDCLCLDVVLADAGSPAPTLDPWTGLAALAAALIAVLQGFGIGARAGEVPGEYCPGRFSVNVDGRVKLAGTAARRVPGATLLSAVLVVDDVEPLRAVTTDVYAALSLPFRPGTTGGAADYVPGLTVDLVSRELLTMAASRVELVEDADETTEQTPIR
jgi:lipoate-protein ligase A